MAEEQTITFIGITLKRSTYKMVQAVCILGLAGLAAICYWLFRESDFAPLRYLWIICAVGAVLEGIEAAYVLNKPHKQE